MQLKLVLLFVGLGLASAIPQPNSRPWRPGKRPGASNTQTGGFSVECGRADNLPDSLLANYIVGGQEAKEGDIPWQVALSSSRSLADSFFCGGCYLGASGGKGYVLTAAHCIGGRMFATLGLHIRSEPGNAITRRVQKITKHQAYNFPSNDIAMLEINLDEAEAKAAGAEPICLPSNDTIKSGTHSIVSGWGTTSENGVVSDVLMYVSKPLINMTDCEDSGNKGSLDETMVCAGDAGRDACQGDSGGPLVTKRNGRFELVGAVSWGYGCARPNYPGVYANVFHFNAWIKDLMGISTAAAQYPINLPVQYPALG